MNANLVLNIKTGGLRIPAPLDRLASFEIWVDSSKATTTQINEMRVIPSRCTALGKELLFRRGVAGTGRRLRNGL